MNNINFNNGLMVGQIKHQSVLNTIFKLSTALNLKLDNLIDDYSPAIQTEIDYVEALMNDRELMKQEIIKYFPKWEYYNGTTQYKRYSFNIKFWKKIIDFFDHSPRILHIKATEVEWDKKIKLENKIISLILKNIKLCKRIFDYNYTNCCDGYYYYDDDSSVSNAHSTFIQQIFTKRLDTSKFYMYNNLCSLKTQLDDFNKKIRVVSMEYVFLSSNNLDLLVKVQDAVTKD